MRGTAPFPVLPRSHTAHTCPLYATPPPVSSTGRYAWVDVDARGSGASFGNRSTAFSPEEIQDGYEILDWLVAQEWSDGRTVSFGVSYDGIAAETLTSLGHPSMKGAAILFSPFDLYTEVRRRCRACNADSFAAILTPAVCGLPGVRGPGCMVRVSACARVRVRACADTCVRSTCCRVGCACPGSRRCGAR